MNTPPTCTICGLSPLRPWLRLPGDWRRPLDSSPWQLCQCGNCGYGRIDPLPAKASIPDFYRVDSYSTHHTSNGSKPSLSPKLRLLRHLAWRFDRSSEPDQRWLSGLIDSAGIRKAADIGCGTGDFLLMLAANGVDAVGIEPDEQARNHAISQGASVYPGTSEELPETLHAGAFDAVFLFHVLEHTRDLFASLTNIRSLLRPGGTLCIEVPNNASRSLDVAGPAWLGLDVPRHLHFFSEPSLRLLLEGQGFAIQAVQYRGYVRQWSADWQTQEGEIRENLQGKAPGPALRSRPAWTLFQTLLAAPSRKYDSIRMLAKKQG